MSTICKQMRTTTAIGIRNIYIYSFINDLTNDKVAPSLNEKHDSDQQLSNYNPFKWDNMLHVYIQSSNKKKRTTSNKNNIKFNQPNNI